MLEASVVGWSRLPARPSGIVAYVATNSTNNGYAGSIQIVLANAFDAAPR